MEIVFDESEMKIIDIYNGKEVEGYNREITDRLYYNKLISKEGMYSVEFDVTDVGKASYFLAALLYDKSGRFEEATGIKVRRFNYEPSSPELQNCVKNFIDQAQRIMQY